MMLGSSYVSSQVPIIWGDEVTRDLNRSYPNAIDGDAVVFPGPDDAPQLWVKYGSEWQRGWAPGSGPGMTTEARPPYKRIISEQYFGFDISPTVTKTVATMTSVGTGHIVLLGLLALYLLRGRSRE